MTLNRIPGRGLLGEDRMLVTSDGRRIRAMVRGVAADLVVLEAGLGFSGLYWGSVHEQLAATTRVVAYERAGFGGSDPDRRPRTLARLAADLDSVIDAFPHRRLVLVGHSWGGPIVRTVAALRLQRGLVPSGLVLVDQSDENSKMYFSSLARFQFTVQAAVMVPLARLRLLAPLSRGLIAGLPELLQRGVVAASCSPAAAHATAAEQRHVIDGLRSLRETPLALGDVPISVISGQRAGILDAKTRASIIRAHEATVSQNSCAHFIPAHGSGHMVPVTDPSLVTAEVLALLDG